MVSSYGCGAIIPAAYAQVFVVLEGAMTVPQDARRDNIVPRRLLEQSDDVDRCVLLALVGGCPQSPGRTTIAQQWH